MGLDNAKPKVLFPHMKKPHCQLPEFLTTPLIEAATFGHIDIVKFLLDNGADPDIKATSVPTLPIKWPSRTVIRPLWHC